MLTLSDILSPHTLAAFVSEYWPHRHLLGRISAGHLATLPSFLFGRDELLDAYNGSLHVWLMDRDGKHRQLREVSHHSAKALYDCGGTIYMPRLELWQPLLLEWMSSLALELGISSPALECNAFVSRAGCGSPIHFDSTEAFMIQVLGQKNWRIAPNTQIEAPPQNFVPSATPLPRKLRDLAGAEVIPPDQVFMTSVEMTPGDTMFVPRGMWHETATVSDSIHLSVVIGGCSWADLLSQHVGRRLERFARWRATAVGMSTSGPFEAYGNNRLEELLGGADDDIGLIEAKEVGDCASR